MPRLEDGNRKMRGSAEPEESDTFTSLDFRYSQAPEPDNSGT